MLFACRIGIAVSDLFKLFQECVSGTNIITCIPIHLFGPNLAGLSRILLSNHYKKTNFPKSKIENGGFTQFAITSAIPVSEFCLGVTNSRKLTHPTQPGRCGAWQWCVVRYLATSIRYQY